ncbi:hypothetical protein RSC3_01664 [Bacillus paralicheniformis]|nr:hypothetical protein RSC3_01664 [Bacillus paralicheniformis]
MYPLFTLKYELYVCMQLVRLINAGTYDNE